MIVPEASPEPVIRSNPPVGARRDRITRLPPNWERHSYRAILIVLFGVLIVTGTTMSSIGTAPLRVDGTDPGAGLIAGTPKGIRSDEFLRTSPWRIGATEDPGLGFGSPLSQDGAITTSTAHKGIASRIVFFDSVIAELGSLTNRPAAFALMWWLPTILFWASGPALLAMFGLSRAQSLSTLALIYFSPTVMWWSLLPITSGLGYSMAAAVLIAFAAKRVFDGERSGRRDLALAVGAIGLAALFVARLPFAYAPWSIVLSGGILLPAALVVADRHGWRNTLKLGAIVAAGAGFLGVLLIVENRHSFSVLNSTVYPGRRRESAESLDVAQLFGAPHLGVLRSAKSLTNTNSSEISTGYLVLIVPSLLAALAMGRRASVATRKAWWALTAVLAVFMAWITVDIPTSIGKKLPVITLSQPVRTDQVVGLLATVLFGITLARLDHEEPTVRRRVAVGGTVATFVLLSMAGSTLGELYIPGLSAKRVMAVSLAFAAGVGVAMLFSRRVWGTLPLIAVALSATWFVNPLQVGFADLTRGEAASAINFIHDAEPKALWATDTGYLDAVLMANAVPSLTGQQWVGPVEKNWKMLDPSGAAEDFWNRGASYIHFSWSPETTAPKISNPTPDIIDVVVSPCDTALGELGLDYVISTAELSAPCLASAGTFVFGAMTRYVYQVSA